MYKRAKRIVSWAFLIIIFLSFNSCLLDRTGGGFAPRSSGPIGEPRTEYSWAADALPGYACPADEIVLMWNVGDPRCREGPGSVCQTLNVLNAAGFPEFTSRELWGEHSVGSASDRDEVYAYRSPEFAFTVQHDIDAVSDLQGWDLRLSYVHIIPPTSPDLPRPYYSLGSACNNISCQWKLDQYRLNMADQSFIDKTKGLGDCVRIVSICYLSGDPSPSEQHPEEIVLGVIEAGEYRELGRLEYEECVEDLSLQPDLEYVVDVLDPLINRETGNCCGVGGETTIESALTPRPFVDLSFKLGCDTASDECT